jgi:TP901 family phage tail tape measure protein
MPDGFLPPLVAELLGKTGEFTAEMKKAVVEGKGATDEINAQGDKMAAHSEKTFGTVGKIAKLAFLGVAGAAVAVGVEAVKSAGNFQKATATIAANSGISQAAADSLGKTFLGTAGKTIFSAQQMATAFAPVSGQLVAMYGHALTNAQGLALMKAASDAAEASGQDLGTTTGDLVNVMQAYHLSASQASQASDVLFNTSRALNVPFDSVTTAVDRMHAKLGNVAPTLQDAGALMLELGQQGIKGTRGIATVNGAFTTLLGGSKATKAELTSLGVNVYDASGKFVGLQSVIGQLGPKLAGMSQEQQNAALKTLFGASAGQAMFQVIKAGLPALDAATAAVGKQGSAAAGAALQSKTFQHMVETAKTAVEDWSVVLGQKLLPVLARIVGDVGPPLVHVFGLIKDAILVVIGTFRSGSSGYVDAFSTKMQWLATGATDVGKAFRLIVNFITGDVIPTFKAIGGYIGQHATLFKSLAVGIIALVAAWKIYKITLEVITVVQKAFNAVQVALKVIMATNPFVIILGALIALGVAFYYAYTHSQTFRDIVQGALRDVKAVAMDVFGYLKGAVFDVWHAMDDAYHAIDGIWQAISGAITAAVDWISSHIKLLIAIFLGPFGLMIDFVWTHWNTLWNAAKSIITVAWTVIRDVVVTPMMAVFRDVLVPLLHTLQTVWGAVWGAIQAVMQAVWTIIKTVVLDPIKIEFGLVKDAVTALGTLWGTVWAGVQSALQTVWGIVKPILDAMKQALDDTVGAAGKALGVVGKIGGGVGKTIGKVFGFADGGVVPGTVGAPMMAVVHGGETVVPPGQLVPGPQGATSGSGGGGAGLHIHVHMDGTFVGGQQADGQALAKVIFQHVVTLAQQQARRNGITGLAGIGI